jgi:hypothetical protein
MDGQKPEVLAAYRKGDFARAGTPALNVAERAGESTPVAVTDARSQLPAKADVSASPSTRDDADGDGAAAEFASDFAIALDEGLRLRPGYHVID